MGARGPKGWKRQVIVDYKIRFPDSTLQEIGDVFNLTRQRIRQILIKEISENNAPVTTYHRGYNDLGTPENRRAWIDASGIVCTYCGGKPDEETFITGPRATSNIYGILKAGMKVNRAYAHKACRHEAVHTNYSCLYCGVAVKRNKKVQEWRTRRYKELGFHGRVFCSRSCHFTYDWEYHRDERLSTHVSQRVGTKKGMRKYPAPRC